MLCDVLCDVLCDELNEVLGEVLCEVLCDGLCFVLDEVPDDEAQVLEQYGVPAVGAGKALEVVDHMLEGEMSLEEVVCRQVEVKEAGVVQVSRRQEGEVKHKVQEVGVVEGVRRGRVGEDWPQCEPRGVQQ